MKTISDLVIINNVAYNVGVISITRESKVVDKYANRTEDGAMHREPLGTYYNYKISFVNSLGDPTDYDRLYEALTTPAESLTLSVPYGKTGKHTYKAYVTNAEDKVYTIHNGNTYWEGLAANFIAMKPART